MSANESATMRTKSKRTPKTRDDCGRCIRVLFDRAEGRLRWYAFGRAGTLLGSFDTREEARAARRRSISFYEAIKVIEAWALGFCLGNTVKYIGRAGKKGGESVLDDLKKARWYLDREITRLEALKEGEKLFPSEAVWQNKDE